MGDFPVEYQGIYDMYNKTTDEHIECESCNGTGKHRMSDYCKYCDIVSKPITDIRHERKNKNGMSYQIVYVKCPKCAKISSSMVDYEQCEQCNGHGIIL